MIKRLLTVRGTTRSTEVGDEGDLGVVAGSTTVPVLESDPSNTTVEVREAVPESTPGDKGMTYNGGS